MTNLSKKSIAVMFATLLVSMSMQASAVAAQDTAARADSICETWGDLALDTSRTEFLDGFLKNPDSKQYVQLASLWARAARPMPSRYCEAPQVSQLSTSENQRLNSFFSESGLNRDEVYAVASRITKGGYFANAGYGYPALSDKEKALFGQLVDRSSDLRNVYRSTDEKIASYLKQRGLTVADLKEF